MEQNKNKYKYVKNILMDRLILEENDLKFWQDVKTNKVNDNQSIMMAERNINSGEHRVNELKEFITMYNL